jgi:polygalacturonase
MTQAPFDIRSYGAVGDGKTLDTEAINKAIAACAAAGGGTVIVPEGNYLTGTISLLSNITFYLEKNATILGTPDLKQYKGYLDDKDHSLVEKLNLPQGDFGFIWHRALIMLDGVENVSITGEGTIDGNSITDPEGEEEIRGPHGILIGQSKNISISNIRIARAGNYNVMGEFVENATFTNLTILEGYDGIHVRGGKNLLIDNCKFYTRDDAIAGGYWEDVLITDSLLNSSCNGLRLIMPATNLEIRDCDIWGPGVFGHRRGNAINPFVTESLAAFIIQPGAWGATVGTLENIHIHDIRIRDLNSAFSFNLFEGNTATSIIVERVIAKGILSTSSTVEAWSEASIYHHVKFKDVSIEYVGHDNPANLTIELAQPKTGSRITPAWGWYIRNVKDIEFENVSLNYTGKEIRPVMIIEKTESVRFKNFQFRKTPNGEQIRVTGQTRIEGEQTLN